MTGYSNNIKSTILLLVRLLYKTYLPNRTSPVRMTYKRFIIMTIFIPVFILVQLSHWVGFFLDELLFRKYRLVKIKNPLFIIGIPRSGTTHLHRTLAKDVQNWTTFTLRELILTPSITERKIWQIMSKIVYYPSRPFVRIIGWIKQKLSSSLNEVHPSSLREPEEDFMTLLPVLSCFLLVHPFPFPEIWRLAYFDEKISNPDKKRIMIFYKSCFQRHLYFHGVDKRIISKNASFCSAIRSLNDTFPDHQLIVTVRNPLQSIPSFLSTMSKGAQLFDNHFHDGQLQEMTLDVLRYYHQYLFSTISDWHQSRYLIIKMEDLTGEIGNSIKNIYNHFHIPLGPSFSQYIKQSAAEARNYQSKHHYSLSEFGLTEEDIIRDFSDTFTRFGYETKY